MKAINNKVIGRVLIYIGMILLTLSAAAGESVIWGVMSITYNGLSYWKAIGAIYAHNWITITLSAALMITVCEVIYKLLSKQN